MRERLRSFREGLRIPAGDGERYWFTRYGKSIVFLVLILSLIHI